jgi:predicted Zn-dependent protease
MGGFFYNLGRLAGPKIRKVKWAYLAATAPEDEVIEAEYAAGADLAAVVRRQSQPSPDAESVRLLDDTGRALTGCLKKKNRKFSFECIHSVEPQAFCLPGGFIFISDSIIELCGRDPNQIAFILAHEMAHVIEGHVMERMLAGSLVKAMTKAGHLRAATSKLGKIGVQFLERAYSRENEFRADRFGVHLALAAGFDAGGAIDLFLRLEPLQKGTTLGPYFSTHPSCSERIEQTRQVLKKMDEQNC